MKIKRFNEKNSEYLTVEDIRDLFLYWIEEVDTEIFFVETTFVDDNEGGFYFDSGQKEFWKKEISETTIGILSDFLPYQTYITIPQLKEFYDKFYLKFSEISDDLKRKGYKFLISGMPGSNYNLEISIIKE
jgi:hypothetical protein